MEIYNICNFYIINTTYNIYSMGVCDMEFLEIVEYVNKNLKEGLSTAKIEQGLKVGKDTLRKKLNRNNYFYNKELNQYILADGKKQIVKSEKVIIQPKTIAPVKKEFKVETKNNTLSIDEIKVLRNIIKEYKAKSEEVSLTTLDFDGEVVVRSIRTYKKVLDKFSTFCKKKDINQKDALATALANFIKNKQ